MANPAGKPVEHGGDLSAVRRRFPDAPLPWLDLSTGINPVPYPVPDLPRDAWARLPAREQAEALIDAAAHRYGVADRHPRRRPGHAGPDPGASPPRAEGARLHRRPNL
jgi:cobalamin biosynthetic protein CobC